MTKQQFETNKKSYGIEGTGIDVTSTKDRSWTNKTTGQVTLTIPAGSKIHIDFAPRETPGTMFIHFNGEVKLARTASGPLFYTGFTKQPTLRTLEKWGWDGIARSVTGKKVEEDGYGPDGSPSWTLVCGMI